MRSVSPSIPIPHARLWHNGCGRQWRGGVLSGGVLAASVVSLAVIGQTHSDLAAQASRTVNVSLTLRNWLIGCYIAQYEQQGTDRAQYGDEFIERLADRLIQAGVSRAEARELRRYRRFYLTYPQIRETLSPELAGRLLPPDDTVYFWESPTPRPAPRTLLGASQRSGCMAPPKEN